MLRRNVAIVWPGLANTEPTMLRCVALNCCDCLAGALNRLSARYNQRMKIYEDQVMYSQLKVQCSNYEKVSLRAKCFYNTD